MPYFTFTDVTKETFVVRIDDSALVAHARSLIAGTTTDGRHIAGTVVTAPGDYNIGWSYRIDPASVGFFDMSFEVGDATMRYVERHLDEVGGHFLPGNRWTPWSSELVDELKVQTGTGRADHLKGTSGADLLFGEGGNDRLDGRGGDDHLVGGAGNDRLLGGDGADKLGGGAGHDRLFGGAGNDILDGGDGFDFLDGGTGADRMTGGGGSDVYRVDHQGDRVIEDKGGGFDVVWSHVSYALQAGQEVEVLALSPATGKAALNLTGNGFDQTLVGNAGGNLLDGRGGADLLIGGGGTDSFQFSTALGGGNVDHIADFSVRSDTVVLDRTIFSALETGVLEAEHFKDIGERGASVDADDRVLYDSRTGTLSYDADGSGEAKAIAFAVLDTRPKQLSHDDFLVVA
ncbi:hypothetical protein ASG52_03795 [Methylobacterium sp. Leaf456]|uniref:calcium-binding protein n=1 Tax=Methylobacterium sp. Leaf456 TaxID=1736382 RepID=UPI000700B46C|nr:calcium-binding protein [Methylobacterium sp. Leaf456]KQT57194.1 hypothetical protein ASG52_03795 [Methylobacterium sp. Leaf456]